CLLAHVNDFGKHVLVSMRATPPPVPALEAYDDEQQTFSIFEGRFSEISSPRAGRLYLSGRAHVRPGK
ncbi:MAG TPA: hypothetical protein VH593_27930, partial [Ktedonobacteraceae bacterium]